MLPVLVPEGHGAIPILLRYVFTIPKHLCIAAWSGHLCELDFMDLMTKLAVMLWVECHQYAFIQPAGLPPGPSTPPTTGPPSPTCCPSLSSASIQSMKHFLGLHLLSLALDKLDWSCWLHIHPKHSSYSIPLHFELVSWRLWGGSSHKQHHHKNRPKTLSMCQSTRCWYATTFNVWHNLSQN